MGGKCGCVSFRISPICHLMHLHGKNNWHEFHGMEAKLPPESDHFFIGQWVHLPTNLIEILLTGGSSLVKVAIFSCVVRM